MVGLVLLLFAAAEDRLADPPLGLDLFMPVPETNPLTRDKVELGRRLFFDKSLSADGKISCSTCHIPKRAFADSNPNAVGIQGRKGKRNVPILVNRGYGSTQFWDGRSATLEDQVLEPIFNPDELGSNRKDLERTTGLRATEISAALASYVRTIRSGNSRFDRYIAGDSAALTPLEKQGLRLFRGKGRCVACHVGPNFSDEQFHNTGVAWRGDRFADAGRIAVSHNPADAGAFKTPSLRNASLTGPYMHDGSLSTLEDVVAYYANGGRPNPQLDKEIAPREFTAIERRALVAFLRALDGEVREGWR